MDKGEQLQKGVFLSAQSLSRVMKYHHMYKEEWHHFDCHMGCGIVDEYAEVCGKQTEKFMLSLISKGSLPRPTSRGTL